MREFLRNALSFRKLQQLCVSTALGNLIAYVAGSLVTLLTTYHTVERRALKNLFGILPRHTVVVHRLPQWLEWTLSILLGYLVMELVRHVIGVLRRRDNPELFRGARPSAPVDDRRTGTPAVS